MGVVRGSRSSIPIPRSFGVCVPLMPPVVLAVVFLLLSDVNVNVVCEVVFSDSDCEYVEPQSFSLQKTRSKCGFEKSDGNDDGARKRKPFVDCARRVLIAKMEKYLDTSCHVTHHAHGYGETQGWVQKPTDGVTKLPW